MEKLISHSGNTFDQCCKSKLKELVEDYEDYLKTRNFQKWGKGSKECYIIRELDRRHNDAVYLRI